MEMPSMRMGSRMNLKVTKQTIASTTIRTNVTFGFRPMVSTCSQCGRTGWSFALCTVILKRELVESCEQIMSQAQSPVSKVIRLCVSLDFRP